MNYQTLKVDLPTLSDETAASLQNFVYALMYAIDEQYHKQIHRHHLDKVKKMLVDSELIGEDLDNPPF